MKHQDLWGALAGMRIAPEGAALSFEERLGREQGWGREKTARVMEEYRRFLYLAATEGAPVTPCKAVDAAWHLHLTYTRHYWDELCGRIVGRPLHHEPTEGGAAETAHYDAQYRATLAAYERAFGAAPPADLWPVPQATAATPSNVGRLRQVVPALTAAVAGTSLLAACTALAAAAEAPEEEASLLEMILGFAILGGIIYFIMRLARRSGRRKGAKRSGAGGGAYTGSDDWDDHDSFGSDSDSGSSCGSSCGSSD